MSEITPERLESFRRRLLDAKGSAAALLDQTKGDEKTVEPSSTVGRLSRMDAIQVQAMSQMSRRQLQIRVLQYEAALAAIDRGNYGICRECKEPISLARLEAVPEAPFCMACQESFER